MFSYLRQFIEHDESKVVYVLSMIAVAMILDFGSGLFCSIIKPEIDFKSKIGINGILRKVASMALLIFFIPLSVLIPGGTGHALLYVLYIGYLMMEIYSIIENYKKMGLNVSLFEAFLDKFKHVNGGDKDE